jgi:hypothetical protein
LLSNNLPFVELSLLTTFFCWPANRDNKETVTDPANLAASAVSTICILVGAHYIVNRSADRITRRMDGHFDALDRRFDALVAKLFTDQR